MEKQAQTERCPFVGETSTIAFDSLVGFCIGQGYQLRYVRELDEERSKLDHARQGAGPLVVSVE